MMPAQYLYHRLSCEPMLAKYIAIEWRLLRQTRAKTGHDLSLLVTIAKLFTTKHTVFR